ncbi:MAG: hypothetical protein PHV06_08000 [bacterium]|nr:hypothetical protein [bacterium]
MFIIPNLTVHRSPLTIYRSQLQITAKHELTGTFTRLVREKKNMYFTMKHMKVLKRENINRLNASHSGING